MKYAVNLHQSDVPEGIDLGYFEFMGVGTVVDSLSAIKKLVFEEKKLTMAEVIDVCRNNFEGMEDVRAMLQNVPCYGNNDPYADTLAKELDRICVDFANKYQGELGVYPDVRYVPFTSHVPFGEVASATPNGRQAWGHHSPTALPPPTVRTSTVLGPSCCPTTPPRSLWTSSVPSAT